MSSKTKGVIYYSDGLIKEPIKSMVLTRIHASGLPVVSSVLTDPSTRSYPTMVRQIVHCLEESTADYVFFCEHDVLYPKTHFDFTPARDDIFYYNSNLWRWDYPKERYITYDRLICLSALCVNRELALNHYRNRLAFLIEKGWDGVHTGEPHWLRKMGYEPGTKKKKRGGFSDDDFDTWHSTEALIDIRHPGTFSPPKVHLEGFTHAPVHWRERHERP